MLRIDTHREASEAVVSAAGELDLHALQDFRQTLLDLAAAGCRLIRLDARRIDYIYSEGIGVLVEVHQRLREAGGQLRIERPSPLVRQVLTLCRLDALFTIVDDAPGRDRAPIAA